MEFRNRPWPGIMVSTLEDAAIQAAAYDCTHVLSLVDPDAEPPDIDELSADGHLVLACEDTDDPALPNCPTEAQVAHFLRWAARLGPDDRLLVHCHAGISRSTAAALAILVQRDGLSGLEKAVRTLQLVRHQAIPNLLIAYHADRLLGAHGAVLKAAFEMGSSTLGYLLVREYEALEDFFDNTGLGDLRV